MSHSYDRGGRRRWGLRRVRVSNVSMMPTFRPGDFLLVWFGGRRLRVDDVVVVARPGMLLVKRVELLGRDGTVTVASDNPSAGVDSRSFGPVPRADVVGRVLCRYWPWGGRPDGLAD